MSSLALVDLAVTGIFIAVSGRLEVAAEDLLANVAILGVVNAAGAWVLFHPIAEALRGRRAVRHRRAAHSRAARDWRRCGRRR